jgi:hypothetical protein
LILTLLHESEHLNKRLVFEGYPVKNVQTPRLNDNVNCYGKDKLHAEGGKFFLESLFGSTMEELDIAQAKYINELENWKSCDNYKEFKKTFTQNFGITDIAKRPSIKLKESDGQVSRNEPGSCLIDQMRYYADMKR